MNALREAGSPKLWLPALCLSFAIVVIPVLAAVALSFMCTQGSSKELGVAAYLRLSHAPEFESFLRILWRGFVVASISSLISLPVGFYIATRRKATVRMSMLGLMLAPFFSSDAIRAYSWSRILAADSLIFRLLNSCQHFIRVDSLRFSEPTVELALCSAVLPFGVMSIVASLPDGDDDFWLVSRDLGVSALWEFWRLALPAAAPGLAIGWMLQFILASFSSVEEQFLGSSNSMQKIASGMINSDLGAGSLAFFALSTVIVLFLGCALLTTGWLIYQRVTISTSVAVFWELINRAGSHMKKMIVGLRLFGKLNERSPPRSWANFWGSAFFLAGLRVLTVIAYLLVLTPILGAVVLAFREVKGGREVWTINNFRYLLDGGSVVSALSRSLFLAALVGALCAIMAISLATVWWGRTRWKVVVIFVVAVGALLPAETYALSILWLVRELGIRSGGIWLAGLGQVAWALPFTVGAVLLAYQKIDISLLEGAWELGGGSWSILSRVVVRLTLPAVFGAALFGFLLSLNEYSRGQYLGGGAEFLSTRVFGRMQSGTVGSGHDIFAVAGGLVLLSLISCFVAMLTGLARKDNLKG